MAPSIWIVSANSRRTVASVCIARRSCREVHSEVVLHSAILQAMTDVVLLAQGLLGWCWADPLVELVIVFYRIREGVAAW